MTKSVTQVNGMKNIIMEVTCFLNVLMINVVLLSYIGRAISYEKFSHNLAFEVQIV